VSSCGSDRVAVSIAWENSLRLLEFLDEIAPTGNLPRDIASSIQRSMRVHLQDTVFSLDEIQSQSFLSEFIKEDMARVEKSSVKTIMDNLLGCGMMRSTAMQWKGVSALGRFAAQILQMGFEIEETDTASTHPSTAILHIKLRLKLPAFLSGAATPWITGVRMKLNGEMSSSTVSEDTIYCCTVLVDTSTVDPLGSSSLGPQDPPLSLFLLKFKRVGDAAQGRRLELVGRLTCTFTSPGFAMSILFLQGAARTGADQASIEGAPSSSMESLIMPMQPWRGHLVHVRRD
jgi:hypothetical protein